MADNVKKDGEFDNRFNGILYLNGNTTVGGFIRGEQLENIKLSGRRSEGVATFQLIDRTSGEVIGEGSVAKSKVATDNPLAPLVHGRMTYHGQTIKLAGWAQVVDGNPCVQLKPDRLAETQDPKDFF